MLTSVIASGRMGTQLQLLGALDRAGCKVTQATVSRDIRELGIQKVRDPLGQPRYALPQERRAAIRGRRWCRCSPSSAAVP